MSRVRTCLWFAREGEAEAAAAFYCTLAPESRIDQVLRPGRDGPAMLVEFTLAGTPYAALNGGATEKPSASASISLMTKDQAETDRVWQAILDNGGREGLCGWLTDRWGVTWQVYPEAVLDLAFSDDKAASLRVQEAIRGMVKLDLAALRAAHEGEKVS
ncbi:VOC family protein [Seohaeicola zhoushanensis]|uniref:VOC family protein n=1 Tax=Seohaeicola zhoushanensis TaxID=1569283 RepID=A0A8J3GYF6_9RHOB|nr:VOC family protein [Seohaeicola zhoushanensis]GHF51289.1 VOC family protein [Seohaeicola zhoushanensis]